MTLDPLEEEFSKYHVPRKPTHYVITAEQPNYKEGWTYCNHCKRNMPKDAVKCEICNKPVRIQPRSKKTGLKRY